MGLVIGRVTEWRRWVAVTAALLAALLTFVSIGRTIKAREEEPRTRNIDFDAAFQASAMLPDLARASSLWLDGRGLECRIAALYGQEESASFSPTVSYIAAVDAPHSVTITPGWVADVSITRSVAYEGPALAA